MTLAFGDARQCGHCGAAAIWTPAAGGLPPHWGGEAGPWCPGSPPGRHTHAPGFHVPFFAPGPWGQLCVCDAWESWHRHQPWDKPPVTGNIFRHEHT